MQRTEWSSKENTKRNNLDHKPVLGIRIFHYAVREIKMRVREKIAFFFYS